MAPDFTAMRAGYVPQAPVFGIDIVEREPRRQRVELLARFRISLVLMPRRLRRALRPFEYQVTPGLHLGNGEVQQFRRDALCVLVERRLEHELDEPIGREQLPELRFSGVTVRSRQIEDAIEKPR